MFPNFDVDGPTADEKTYFVDDITYSVYGFGGTTGAIEADPDDSANMVAQVTKSATADTWGGATLGTLANQAIVVLPLKTGSLQMQMAVRSPRSGVQIRLKVEDANDSTHSVETEATTTGVDTWETLTFDFGTPAAGTAAFNDTYTYNKLSVFGDFDTSGASGGTGAFYFDDINMVP